MFLNGGLAALRADGPFFLLSDVDLRVFPSKSPPCGNIAADNHA
jgi:hypothetical protein